MSSRTLSLIRRQVWILSCVVLCSFLAPAADAQAPAQAAAAAQPKPSQREKFAAQLQTFAKVKAGADRDRYFALMRRGMDRFDERAAQAGDADAVEFEQIALDQLDPAPTDADRARDAQYLTTLRTGFGFEAEQRIIGGFPAADGQYEEVVALTGNGFLCSGIALDGRHVLTAAHCACDLGLLPGQNTDPLATIKIGVRTDAPVVKQRFLVDAAKTRMFPDNTGISCNAIQAQVVAGRLDIAVIEIRDGGSMQVRFARIQKPEIFAPSVPRTKEDGPAFFLFGFGCTIPEQVDGRFLGCRGQNSGTKEAALIYYSVNCARESEGGFAADAVLGNPVDFCAPHASEFILSNFFKKESPADTCAGDSGGPVMQLNPGDTSAEPFRLVGITSRSLHPQGHCGFGGIYTKIADATVIAWLKGMPIDLQD
jgi:Trypsin